MNKSRKVYGARSTISWLTLLGKNLCKDSVLYHNYQMLAPDPFVP